jgi:hypothetical protein
MKIRIETETDSHDCETCGSSYSQGGKVFVDDVLVLEKPALAHCYDGRDYSDSDLLVLALAKLGHEVEVDGCRYHISSHDDDYHGPIEN